MSTEWLRKRVCVAGWKHAPQVADGYHPWTLGGSCTIEHEEWLQDKQGGTADAQTFVPA